MSSIGSVGAGTILGSSFQSASLSFQAALVDQQDLAIKTATSGLQGLLASMDETGMYQSLMTGFSQSVELVGQAGTKAAEKPFKAATSAQVTAQTNATNTSYDTRIDGFTSGLNSARTQAVNARNGTDAGTAERTAGDKVVSAADSLIALRNAMDATVPDTSQAAAVVTEAQTARDAAHAAWVAAPAGERKAEAQAVLDAAENVLAQAKTLKAFSESSLTKIQGKTPTVHDLGDGYTMATWGNSGVTTILGPDGKGILINHDGTVDNIGMTDQGWKFNNTSSFVLPNDTKITFAPGTPASVLVTRGNHMFEIDNLRAGQNPNTGPYKADGGRKEDKKQNDGHIYVINGSTTSSWKTLGGNVLGDGSTREVVATSPINNEHKLDPTDIALTPQLKTFIESLGITLEDYDSDGKYNDEELFGLAQIIQRAVDAMQEAFAASLLRIAQATGALMELTTFLEKIRAEGEAKDGDKQSLNAEDAAVLADIERRLVSAFNALKGAKAAESDIVNPNAQQTPAITQPPVQPSDNGQNNSSNVSNENSALQRLSRLLSGFSSIEIPDVPTTEDPLKTLPPEVLNLAQALEDLKDVLVGRGLVDDSLATGQLPPLKDLSIGLENFLNALAANRDIVALGLPPTQDGQYFQGLFSDLSISVLTQQELSELAPSLLGLVGAFAELGQFQDADLPPSISGQPAPAAPGALRQESRLAENLRLVLQGLASLSTPGFDQSAPGQVRADLEGRADGEFDAQIRRELPTPEEIRKGLEMFLSALATLGLFAPPAPVTVPSGGADGGSAFGAIRDSIATITSNFYTDPELLARLNEHLQHALKVHSEQLSRASTLFSDAQEAVRDFVTLIKQEGLVTDVVLDDMLSDQQQDKFADKMKELQKQWGVDWGDSTPSTPSEEVNLVSKLVQSGTMV
jgi:hypothetical protein